ncbi:MAG: penicillin-binding protein activator LpoB [Verrucomicrobiota bacterium JB024]|nr:penicillin-binding protein activator LpoB [Verrucomicrobiota bacterium JB024]
MAIEADRAKNRGFIAGGLFLAQLDRFDQPGIRQLRQDTATQIGQRCRRSGRNSGGPAKYVDSAGPRTIVSVDEINIQDWSSASDQMIDSLLSSGVLERAPSQPAVLAVSRIINDTRTHVDTDLLTKRIRIALNRSGKAMTTTTIDVLASPEDPLAAAVSQKAAPTPFFSLSGKILEVNARAGDTKQVTYVFQLSLTEITTGLAVWEDQVEITKQGSRASVGW